MIRVGVNRVTADVNRVSVSTVSGEGPLVSAVMIRTCGKGRRLIATRIV